MTRAIMSGVLVLTLVGITGGLPAPAGAQGPGPGVDVSAPPPGRSAPEFGLERTQPPQQQGAREQEFYPGPVRSRHEPAFVTPFVATVPTSRTSAVRLGLSGWTAPAVPYDIPQASGGVAFGFTFLWGVPVAEAPAPSAEPTGQR